MLVLNPRRVTFAGQTWSEVAAVVIDRQSKRTLTEWSDLGPHAVFADAPEQLVTVRVVQKATTDDLHAPTPGDAGELSFAASPSGADSPRRRLRAQCVVTEVTHELSLTAGAVRTLRLVALSPDGAADPITTEPADGTA